jgi:4-amino-4-deoxy-L-arabinose transferase-like glycosyltransferase
MSAVPARSASQASAPDSAPALAVVPLTVVALAFLALLLVCLTQYGWFRDEFYYLACADHLATGYVDHPPLSIWALAAWRALFGESLATLRLLPALLGAATVFFTGALARPLGGGRGAQMLAALAACTAPVLIGTFHYVSMNSFDLLLWLLAFHAWVRVVRTGTTGAWLALGIVLGLGVLNKLSVLWLVAGLGAGLLLGRERRMLRTRGPWLAALSMIVLSAPYVAWQLANDWPTVEFMRNATGRKMTDTSLLQFWLRQVLAMNPATVLVWLPGLAWLLVARDGRRWRALGVAYLVVVLIILSGGRSRASYLAPAYLALFAAGAVALERALRGRAALLRHAVAGLVVVSGAVAAPLAAPVLPVERFIAYSRALGMAPSTDERHAMGPLPQHYADMYGWQELTDVVARAWTRLSPEERAHAAIFGQNYGEAGAIHVLGRSRGLAPVISGHNNFWLWGPPAQDIRVLVIIGGDEEDNRRYFGSLERVGEADHPYAMPYERHMPVWIGRDPKIDLRQAWVAIREFI